MSDSFTKLDFPVIIGFELGDRGVPSYIQHFANPFKNGKSYKLHLCKYHAEKIVFELWAKKYNIEVVYGICKHCAILNILNIKEE